MKIIVLLAAALLATTPVAARETLKYSTTVAGIPLGKVKVVVEAGEPDYSVRASFKMIPLLRQIFNGDANARVDGSVIGGRYVPRESIFNYEGRKRDQRTTIRFDASGAPVDLVAEPPLRKKSYAMSLGEAAGSVDPATAAAILMSPREKPCDIAFDVFDGAKRHRVSLTGQAFAARGNTVTCAGLYERVNGFKDKYMTPDRRTWPFVATLVAQGGMWVPVKITADTKFGPASATLKD